MKKVLITVLLTLGVVSVCMANPFAGGSSGQAEVVKKPESSTFYTYLTAKQKELRNEITSVFRKIKEKPFSFELFVFALLSFTYGVFHSMGPGHAKTLVSGYMLTSSGGIKRAALFGTVVAFGHAFTSFLLVLILFYIMKASVISGFDNASGKLASVSYVLIFCIGLYLLYKKIRPSSEHRSSSAGMAGSAAAISLTPCPGAMVLAVFCLSGGLPLLGALSVFSMALGMAVTISAVAVLTTLVKMKGSSGRYKNAYSFLEYAGAAVLICFSSFMLIF